MSGPPKPPPTTPPKPKPRNLPTVAPKGSPKAKQRKVKVLSLSTPKTENTGEKLVIYGKSGIGKSSLAALAPNPIFLDVDGTGAKLSDRDGNPIQVVDGVESFEDVQDAIRQVTLYPAGSTLIIDTWSKVQDLADVWVVENIPKQKGGKAKSLTDFGYGDGYAHVCDQMQGLLRDLDALIARNVNVVLLCQLGQATVSNAAGADFLEDGPRLHHNKKGSARAATCEWGDHVLRVGYLDFEVETATTKDKVGKVTSEDAERGIFAGGAQHFIAKSRPLTKNRTVKAKLPSVVSFEDDTDPSLWLYLLEGAEIATEDTE